MFFIMSQEMLPVRANSYFGLSEPALCLGLPVRTNRYLGLTVRTNSYLGLYVRTNSYFGLTVKTNSVF